MSATIYFSDNLIMEQGFINPDMHIRAVYFTLSIEEFVVLAECTNITVLNGKINEPEFYKESKHLLETKNVDFSEVKTQTIVEFTEKEEKDIEAISKYMKDMRYVFIRNM